MAKNICTLTVNTKPITDLVPKLRRIADVIEKELGPFEHVAVADDSPQIEEKT